LKDLFVVVNSERRELSVGENHGMAAALRIPTMRPFTLSGTGFAAGERVRIVVSSDGVETVTVVQASSVGAFETVFRDVRTGRSVSELAVDVRGSRGSRASFTLNQPLGSEDLSV
jgi:hypothetical protein